LPEKTAAHDVIRVVSIEKFLDDDDIDDLVFPASCLVAGKR